MNPTDENIFTYEISINQIDYTATYVFNRDYLYLCACENENSTPSDKPVKIIEAYDFQRWVRDNDLLREGMLQFSPEQDDWIDTEWEIPFSAFLHDDDKAIREIYNFLLECGLDL